jgi:outer membrane lipoprotein-sorting protein
MANRLTPALLIRETKHFVVAKNLNLNRETITALLLALTVVGLLCLPNPDRNAFEAVHVGMPQETLTGLELTVNRNPEGEIRTWRDRVKYPLRKYEVTLRNGKVTDKRVLP